MAGSVLQATASFIARVGGVDVSIREGDLADADAEIVKKYPTLFGPAAVRFTAPPARGKVEQATKAPGEKRGA